MASSAWLLELGREHLDELLAGGADPALVADESDGAEQVTLDQERVEAGRASRLGPTQD